MSEEKIIKGRCFCGAVELEVVGAPAAMGYCHCTSCREWSASPVNAFTLWPPSEIRITRGAEQLATYHKTEHSYRKWCTRCGGHVLTEHPHWGLIDVYSAVIAAYPFVPQLHVNYVRIPLRKRDHVPGLEPEGGLSDQPAPARARRDHVIVDDVLHPRHQMRP